MCNHIHRLWVAWLLLLHGAAAAAAGGADQPPPHAPVDPLAIPSIAIIGTSKGGTSDMYAQLKRVTAGSAGPQALKEPRLLFEEGGSFAFGFPQLNTYLQRIGHPCAAAAGPQRPADQPRSDGLPRRALLQYLPVSATAEDAAAAAAAAFFECASRLDQGGLTIDATPVYLPFPHVPQVLRALSRDTKVIVMLRDPLDRCASLYNHRAHAERQGIVPQRLSNVSLDEWARRFLDWVDATPGVPESLRALAAARDATQQAQLYRRLVEQANLLGRPPGRLSFRAFVRAGNIERSIFGPALYAAALAPWRAEYFVPGRVLVVDSHAYFADRLGVLAEVLRWLHGRPATAAELGAAGGDGLVENARRRAGIVVPGAQLSAATEARLRAFYLPHVRQLLGQVLPAMQAEGAAVVGFQGPPWTSWLAGNASGAM